MRLYVTGGTGFVGSNIIKVALERYNATVFSTAYSRLPEGTPGLEYGRVNMLDPQQVLNCVRAFQPNAIIHAAILWMEMKAAVDVHPPANCSRTIAASRRLRPVPPTSSRIYRPPKPSDAAARKVSIGKNDFSSHSCACGAICSRANSAASDWNARWSSESSKFMDRALTSR